MVRIGIAGIGFMGMIHYLAARQIRGGQVTAICSRDPKKLAGDWRSIRGNFGPCGDLMDLSQVKKYERLDDLLSDPAIDLVDVCNPTSVHGDTALRALAAGKHVLVEKPIALEVSDADAMVDAAEKAQRLLMVAHVLPFFPEFAYARRCQESGEYGRLRAAHFKRIISKPDWSADIGDIRMTGGPAIDLHIHDTHFIGLLCGLPRQVFSAGVMERGAVTYLTTQYLYGPSGPCVSCCSGALAQSGRPFVHGFEMYLEDATLVYESGATPLTVLKADGTQAREPVEENDVLAAFRAELQAAVEAVATGLAPPLLRATLARDALSMCHRECQSVSTGRAVAVN
jgi:predicted dehydrogenase